MKSNSSGYSLIELLVVVAIISICVGLGSLSFAAASSARVSKCAREMDSLLSQCRMTTLAKGDSYYIKLYTDDGSVYGEIWDGDELVSTDTLGSNVTFTFTTDAVSAVSSALCLAYDRATGAFEPLDDDRLGTQNAEIDGEYCTALQVSNGSKTITITLTPETGRSIIGG